MKFTMLLGVIVLSLSACQRPPTTQAAIAASAKPQVIPSITVPDTGSQDREFLPVSQERVSVMSYNLYNLFDDVQDTDEAVIPTAVLQAKLARIAQGILQVNSGRGPDILLVQEVENLNVLHMLNQHLQAAGYGTIELLDADDERGIDVGVISRLPLAGETVLHRMPFEHINKTRGILEVPLRALNGKVVRAFAFHFPSQANPVDQRLEAIHYLKELMLQVPVSEYAVAAGDSNVNASEENRERFFSDVLKDFQVSHLVGCNSCKGTYSYRGVWSFFDVIISREANLVGESVVLPKSAPTQINSDGTPRRFNNSTYEGISDHLPIYAEILVTH
ncbi:endonuclease/exonuclease/phosphatase family protein [Pseudobdellovibrio exovorus]|uniref:Endonuclease/exonuclease/phosphatase domain-containing protein n=1 Tax=Pseudobdellovibrio exovorus JSS TaxID=1184267 RepID=M4VQE2_9BACT|nr:hypothetical protein [Pseudobdellovibrio exovorus]AGH95374.1 hypothetical protein A11Q_1158 [Pseudobdellovibrio exovorus JSS]